MAPDCYRDWVAKNQMCLIVVGLALQVTLSICIVGLLEILIFKDKINFISVVNNYLNYLSSNDIYTVLLAGLFFVEGYTYFSRIRDSKLLLLKSKSLEALYRDVYGYIARQIFPVFFNTQ